MTSKEIREKTTHCLITYREKMEYSQEYMAELCSLSLPGYQDIEQGIIIPSLTTAQRIRSVTGIDLNTLTLPE